MSLLPAIVDTNDQLYTGNPDDLPAAWALRTAGYEHDRIELGERAANGPWDHEPGSLWR
jgi:hypothetical protein